MKQAVTPTVTNTPPLQDPIIQQRLGTSPAELETLCKKWHLTELALFGSILRDDFRPDSDIDLLASFSPSFHRGLTETLQIRDDFTALFSRKIDLVIKDAIERSPNWIRRQEILETAQVIYVAE